MFDLFEYCIDKVYQYVPGPKKRVRNKFNFRCPICGDSAKNSRKKRAWLTQYGNDKVGFGCFNCDKKFNAYTFLSIIENKEISEVKRDIFEKRNLKLTDVFKKIVKQPTQDKTPIKEENYIKSSLDWLSLNESASAKKIIENRKVLEAPFIPPNWDLKWNKKTNRIVIPWIRDGKLAYYQERSLTKNDPQKYLFPKDTQKDLSGLDQIDPSFPYLFFTEGVFDQVWVKNGITIGGTFLSEHQESLLELYQNFKWVYLLDNQHKDEKSMKVTKKLAKEGKTIFIWPKNIKEKDINDYVIKNGSNPFKDESFLLKNTFKGLLGLMHLNLR